MKRKLRAAVDHIVEEVQSRSVTIPGKNKPAIVELFYSQKTCFLRCR